MNRGTLHMLFLFQKLCMCNLKIGDLAPDFMLQDQEGKYHTLKKFRGKGLGLKLIQFSNNSYNLAMVLSGSEGTENFYLHFVLIMID